MKFLLLFLLLNSSAIAQPIITNNINPQAGNTFVFNGCDSVSAGQSGSNVTWQFSTLICPASVTWTYQDCPGAQDCSIFPGSNRAIVIGVGTASYYIADANRFAQNGESSGGTVIYSNPRDVRRYPMQYGNTYSDSHKAIITSTNNWTREGTLVSTADAWGTLILPNATYPNTLRIHWVDEYTDSNHVSTLYSKSNIRDVYEWYTPGYNSYLLHIEQLRIMTISDTTMHNTVVYTIQTPNNINEINHKNRISIYPVPAKNNINIEFAYNAQSIEMMDIVGKSVVTITGVKGQSTYQINTNGIPAGIYLIRINTDNGTVTRKIEVQ